MNIITYHLPPYQIWGAIAKMVNVTLSTKEDLKHWFGLSAASNKSGPVAVPSHCLTRGLSYWLHFHYRAVTRSCCRHVSDESRRVLFAERNLEISEGVPSSAACLYWRTRGSGVEVGASASGHRILMPALKSQWNEMGGGWVGDRETDGENVVVMRLDFTVLLSRRAATGRRAPTQTRTWLRPLGEKQNARSGCECSWTNSVLNRDKLLHITLL